jgi:hypothetical protein
MFSIPHSPSAWLASAGPVLLALFLLRLCLWRSPWALIPWLSLTAAVFLCTAGLAIGAVGVLFTPSEPAVFHPIAFAGPLFAALLGGIVALTVLWFSRPRFPTLKRQHWTLAIISLPCAALSLFLSPNLFARDLTIHCSIPDGLPVPGFTLQRMQENQVVEDGPPLQSADGAFHIHLNSHESFTAGISAAGYQGRLICVFPIPKQNCWLVFEGGEPRRVPLTSPVTLDLKFEPSKSTEPGGAANRGQPVSSETNRAPSAAGPGG